MKIDACALYHARIWLAEPYVLSFAVVKAIDVLVLRLVTDEGGVGVAEAVPLPGYTSDTRESTEWALLHAMEHCIGADPVTLHERFARLLKKHPFALSALLTAAELAQGMLSFDQPIRVPLLAPVSSSLDTNRVVRKVGKALDAGFRTIKLKVGKDLAADRATVEHLLDWLPDGVALRIDANQGYDLEQARQFVKSLEHPRAGLVELFEQPFAPEAWDTFREFAERDASVPLMLDESIVEDGDIERAAKAGASYVKLKLFKHAGVSRLLDLACRAGDLGMRVVLGNGVATDIGNLVEAELFSRSGLFAGAFEGNGFAKLAKRFVANPLAVSNGDLVWDPQQGSLLSDGIDYAAFDCIHAIGTR